MLPKYIHFCKCSEEWEIIIDTESYSPTRPFEPGSVTFS